MNTHEIDTAHGNVAGAAVLVQRIANLLRLIEDTIETGESSSCFGYSGRLARRADQVPMRNRALPGAGQEPLRYRRVRLVGVRRIRTRCEMRRHAATHDHHGGRNLRVCR